MSSLQEQQLHDICCICRCVRELYGIAKTNWDAFVGPDIVDLFGHLMIYPMLINQDGRHVSGPTDLASQPEGLPRCNKSSCMRLSAS